MTEITPPYYAAGRLALSFNIVGRGFSQISGGVRAVTARANNFPLEYINHSFDNKTIIEAQVISDNLIVAQGAESDYPSPRFVGALVSMDRTMIYWVNETKPL